MDSVIQVNDACLEQNIKGKQLEGRRSLKSVQGVVKVGQVGGAPALLVPRPGAFPDQVDPFIAFHLREGPGHARGFHAGEVVPVSRHRVNPADRAEEIRVGVLIAHDAAGNGSHPVLALERPIALFALHLVCVVREVSVIAAEENSRTLCKLSWIVVQMVPERPGAADKGRPDSGPP